MGASRSRRSRATTCSTRTSSSSAGTARYPRSSPAASRRKERDMPSIQKDIVVDVPIKDAYDQWTQFESFPQFMEGVKEVVQLDEKTLRWRASVGGKEEEWEAEIVEQTPDRHVAWRSTAGTPNAGSVLFQSQGADRTRVSLEISYEP